MIFGRQKIVVGSGLHAKCEALPSLGLRVNVFTLSSRVTMMPTHLTPCTLESMNPNVVCCTIPRCRDVGRKAPPLCVFFCTRSPPSISDKYRGARWARLRLRTSTSSCPCVYWHSEHETTAGSVTDYWHHASRRENMFSHRVLTRQTVIHNTILSDPAHKESPKTPAVAIHGHVLFVRLAREQMKSSLIWTAHTMINKIIWRFILKCILISHSTQTASKKTNN